MFGDLVECFVKFGVYIGVWVIGVLVGDWSVGFVFGVGFFDVVDVCVVLIEVYVVDLFEGCFDVIDVVMGGKV